jgi:16S rRNA (adenine1518-N6/adenine1519-N6)-dimethyltransferase
MKIKAKKQFGQNFLKDERVLDKIIESMPINSNKIVEIGPTDEVINNPHHP